MTLPRSSDHDNPQWSSEMDVNQEKPLTLPPDFEFQPIRVDKIHIDGLGRTKDDIIKTQVDEIFKAKNLYNVREQVERVISTLEKLDCFKKIGVIIDTSKGPNATPNGVEITFNVLELKRLSGGISSSIGNNEGSVVIRAKTPNILGRGEKFQMEYSYGSSSSSNFNVSLGKPLVNSKLYKVVTANVFANTIEAPKSNYKQRDHGILLDLALNPFGALKHNFQYEANYRNLTAGKTSSFYVRNQSGPSLKSALRHIVSIDKRDTNIFPSRGSLVKFTTELAGLGGDVGFIKHNFELQSNWTPHEYITLQLGAQAGIMRGISNDMAISMIDHFFLGGPLNLRGYSMRGCGPMSDGDPTGGDRFWALAVHMYTPLPFIPRKNAFANLFRLHGFVNGGNLGNGGSYSEYMQLFTNNVRCSAGTGIVAGLFGARLEFNVVWPLCAVRSDVFQKYQFGIGLEYL